MAKNKNPWIAHLADVREKHPKIKDVKELAALAKKSYKPKK